MSRTPCGVAIIASNVLFHLKPAKSGHDDFDRAGLHGLRAPAGPGARKTM